MFAAAVVLLAAIKKQEQCLAYSWQKLVHTPQCSFAGEDHAEFSRCCLCAPVWYTNPFLSREQPSVELKYQSSPDDQINHACSYDQLRLIQDFSYPSAQQLADVLNAQNYGHTYGKNGIHTIHQGRIEDNTDTSRQLCSSLQDSTKCDALHCVNPDAVNLFYNSATDNNYDLLYGMAAPMRRTYYDEMKAKVIDANGGVNYKWTFNRTTCTSDSLVGYDVSHNAGSGVMCAPGFGLHTVGAEAGTFSFNPASTSTTKCTPLCKCDECEIHYVNGNNEKTIITGVKNTDTQIIYEIWDATMQKWEKIIPQLMDIPYFKVLCQNAAGPTNMQ